MDEDKAKIDSLEVELSRLREVNRVTKKFTQSVKTKLEKSESLPWKVVENLAEIEHIMFELHFHFEDANKIRKEEFALLQTT